MSCSVKTLAHANQTRVAFKSSAPIGILAASIFIALLVAVIASTMRRRQSDGPSRRGRDVGRRDVDEILPRHPSEPEGRDGLTRRAGIVEGDAVGGRRSGGGLGQARRNHDGGTSGVDATETVENGPASLGRAQIGLHRRNRTQHQNGPALRALPGGPALYQRRSPRPLMRILLRRYV